MVISPFLAIMIDNISLAFATKMETCCILEVKIFFSIAMCSTVPYYSIAYFFQLEIGKTECIRFIWF